MNNGVTSKDEKHLALVSQFDERIQEDNELGLEHVKLDEEEEEAVAAARSPPQDEAIQGETMRANDRTLKSANF